MNPNVLIFLESNWLTILFGIIGLASAVYGYLTWKSARKERRVYAYLFELAEKNIDKNITEDELRKRRQEVDKVSQQVEALQEQIRRDIPKEARRTVLKDKLNAHITLLNQYLQSTRKINEELAQLGNSAEMPPELLKAIESEIGPNYLLKEKQENLKTYLTVLTASAAIASAFPYEIGRFLGILLLLPAALIVLLLFKISLPYKQSFTGFLRSSVRANKKVLLNILAGLAVVCCAVGVLFSVIFLLLAAQGGHTEAVILLAVIATALCFPGGYLLVFLLKNSKLA